MSKSFSLVEKKIIPKEISGNFVSRQIYVEDYSSLAASFAYQGAPVGVATLEFSNDATDPVDESSWSKIPDSDYDLSSDVKVDYLLSLATYRWLRFKFEISANQASFTNASIILKE